MYIEKGLYQVTGHSPLLVIDGQQRLTTVSLLLAALAEHIGRLPPQEQEPVEGFSPRKLRNYYLVNPEEEGAKHHKLILSQTDRDSLIAVIDGKDLPTEYSKRIQENYSYFQDKITHYRGGLASVCEGIAKLVVVDISLNRDQDNPQLIFESMNSTGRELTQADLIRNYVLMGLEPASQTRLYQDYWRPMEVDFGQDAYVSYFDNFMRYYLTIQTGDIPRLDRIYDVFKKFSRESITGSAGVEPLVADIRNYARYFCAIALDAEPDPQLHCAFEDLRELKVDVALPLLLKLYHDYRYQVLSRDELLKAVRFIEAYVFRRAVCSIPTNSLDKTFATFTRDLDKKQYLAAIAEHFLSLPSYRRFPKDEEFRSSLQTRDLYNFRSRSYWLRRIENYGRKERVSPSDYTTEHILPRNENLSAEWRAALGPDWKQIRERYLHTLGNLTLTGYNSEYSDRPFNEKRDMKGGFRESPLRLNRGLGFLAEWNEQAIRARTDELSDIAIMVWPMPHRQPDVPAAFKPRETPGFRGADGDHPSLVGSATRDLFMAFRKEMLALDPVVAEHISGSYISYRAETNFVDILPQAEELVLSLNIAYADLVDPRDLCRDVSDMDHPTTGDVEVVLSSMGDMPYIISLVRQAFDRQVSNGKDE